MRYKISLCYSGAEFCGWQVQPSAPSVQETLERALGTLLRTETQVTGTGRTDTGVNATDYVGHFDAAGGLDTAQLCYKLNAILPHSIAIREIRPVEDSFHARFSISKREYTYFLHRAKDPFVEKNSWLYAYPQLDFEKMNEASALLLGTHDFSCFEKTGSDNKTSICTIYEAGWHEYSPFIRAYPDEPGIYWYFRISGNRFLRNMVRAIVGTLLEVGRGKRETASIQSLLEEGTRSDAGESVPGHALFLTGADC